MPTLASRLKTQKILLITIWITFALVVIWSVRSSDKNTTQSADIEAVDSVSVLISDPVQDSNKVMIELAQIDGLDGFKQAWLGTPYLYSGHSKSGTDCSGLAFEYYKELHSMTIERSSFDMHKAAKKVAREDLIEGDLVFFHTNNSAVVNHVGIYLGDGEFIHSSTKKGVIISTIEKGYYDENFVSGGKFH